MLNKMLFVALLLLFTSSVIAQEKLTPTREYSFSPWGYTNEKGKTVISPKFKTASEFYGNLAYVSDENGYFLINRKGKRIFKENCDEIKVIPDFDNAFLVKITAGTDEYHYPKYVYNIVRQDGEILLTNHSGWISFAGKLIIYRIEMGNGSSRFGIVNLKGEIIAAPVNYDLPRFFNGLAIVRTSTGYSEKYGAINLNGEAVVPFEYENAGFTYGDYHKIIWAKTSDNKYHFFDKDGKMIANMIADEFKQLSNNNYFKPELLIRKDNKWGFFNGDEFVLNFDYDEIFRMSDSLVEIKVNGKSGIASTKGTILVPAKYISVKDAGDSYFTAKSETGTHLFSGKGVEIAVLSKDIDIIRFYGGIGTIRQGNLYGYVDHTGKIIIPCQYDDAGAFYDGRAHVKIYDVFKGYIDLSGNRVSENELEREKAEAAKAAERAKEEAAKATELAKAEKEKETKNLNTYFPYRYSDAYCSIRLSKAPDKNHSSNQSWGDYKSVFTSTFINGYMVGCHLVYRINNAKEAQLARTMHISLLQVYKKSLEETGLKLLSVESCKFRGYDAFRYYYEKDDIKSRAIAFQVGDNVFSLSLMGHEKYYDDTFFDLFTGTFELK